MTSLILVFTWKAPSWCKELRWEVLGEVHLHSDFKMSVGLSLEVWLVALMTSLSSLVVVDKGEREEPAIVGGPLKLQEEERL